MYRISFKKRIWFSFVILISLAIGATGFISYLIAEDIVTKNVIEQNRETVAKTAQVLDEKLRKTMITVQSFMISDTVKEAVLSAEDGDESSYFYHLATLQNTFAQAKLTEPLIDSIIIATPIGDYYPLNNPRLKDASFYKLEAHKQIQETERPIWLPGHKDTYFSGNRHIISFVMQAIINEPIHNVYMMVNIREDMLIRDIFHNLASNHYHLISKENLNVLHRNDVLLDSMLESGVLYPLFTKDSGFFNLSFEDSDYLVNYAELEVKSDWILVSIQPKSELLEDVNQIKRITAIITVGFILIAFFFSGMLTSFLLKPLLNLRSLMKRVEQNDLSVRFNSKYSDEVSQVGFSFNRMLQEVEALITEIKNVETEKRIQEVKALQAQIDPHFLHNTLNTIYWKTELMKMEDVRNMVKSLSLIFKLGLNEGKEMTTLKNELSHVTEYLNLQQQCYENLFGYHIHVDPNIDLEQPMLKLLLQPLVENSIIHGFKNYTSNGKIIIQVSEQDQKLCIAVRDNGEGMNVKSVSEELLLTSSASSGYALRNIYQRLHLFYGDTAKMDIRSDDKTMTEIILRLPTKGVLHHE